MSWEGGRNFLPAGPSLLYIINWNCLQTETKFEIQDESTEIEGTELEFDLKAPVKKKRTLKLRHANSALA